MHRMLALAALIALSGCSSESDSSEPPVGNAIPVSALPMTPPAENASVEPDSTPTPESAPPVASNETADLATDSSGDPATPSFNCTVKLSSVEALICGNANLAALDLRLAALYIGAGNGATAEQLTDLRATQRTFLNTRNACTTDACIATAYRDRIADFEEDRD